VFWRRARREDVGLIMAWSAAMGRRVSLGVLERRSMRDTEPSSQATIHMSDCMVVVPYLIAEGEMPRVGRERTSEK